ncbi:hypothetical protein GONAM_28_00520 [Gordonia namibiensis NBRC 108229]|uniref:CBM6 domain-containing protein n=1 Tax=Gordonia namibiensis NBRC 108229 TaxID=1208314 RepID=K6XRS5_9ACTN|nr:hypothetical protein GONAM_28_00520 [Gordonia namibiensis NBRC 108229]
MWGSGSSKHVRTVVGGIVAGAALTAAAISAGPANAALQGIAVDTLPGYGSSANGSSNYNLYGAGCAYTLSVIVGDPKSAKSTLKVTSTRAGRTVTIYNARPTAVEVTPTWRPSAPGRYVLAANLDGVVKTRTVDVGTGVQLPQFIRNGACFVLPTY